MHAGMSSVSGSVCGKGKGKSNLDDLLHSLLCVGGILVTLLIEKLELIVMGEIGSCHLSFETVARRCF